MIPPFENSLSLMQTKDEIHNMFLMYASLVEKAKTEESVRFHVSSMLGFCSVIIRRAGGNPQEAVDASLKAGEQFYKERIERETTMRGTEASDMP